MAGQFRPKLGMGLQSIVAGDRWDQGFPTPIGLPRRPIDESGQMDTGDFTGIPKTMPGTGDMQTKKPGFFGEGGMGRYIAGAIGDALLQNADMQPIFAPMQRDKQRLASEQAQWGLRRQGELADYEQKQQIEAKYRKPTPHYFESNDGSVGMIGPDGKPQILYKDPTPKMNFIPDGLGGGQWVAVPGQAPAMPSAPTGNGGLPQGYTVRKPGGGAGNGTSGFQR